MKTRHLVAVLLGLATLALVATDAAAMYNPALGAFPQRDPGPGGMMAAPAPRIAGGPAMGGGFLPRDAIAQYRDGMNLYQYVGSSPVERRDPSGLRWGSGDFVYHYFTGHGEPIDLNDPGVDLLQTFQNAPDVQAKVAEYRNIVSTKAAEEAKSLDCCKTQSEDFQGNDTTVTNVTGQIFSVGHSTFFRSHDCTLKAVTCSGHKVNSWTCDCTLTFSIRDAFADPLDLGHVFGHDVEVPGGTPYPINASWEENFQCGGT